MLATLKRCAAIGALLLVCATTPALAQSTPNEGGGGSSNAATPQAQAPAAEISVDYGYDITIVGTPEFVAATRAHLDTLASLPSGRAILARLGASEHSTTIEYTPENNAYAGAYDLAGANLASDGTPGSGSDAVVRFNPDIQVEGSNAVIVLGHELLHALHYHEGTRDPTLRTEGPNAGTRNEELRTIGTDGYEDELLSENVLRREWNEAFPDAPIPGHRYGHGRDAYHEHPDLLDDPLPLPWPIDARAPPGEQRRGVRDVIEDLIHRGGE